MSITDDPGRLLDRAMRDAASAGGAPDHRMRFADGSTMALDVRRWTDAPTADELELLRRAVAPVLDVGCGPGRHVAALEAAGIEAVGIDILPEALAQARRRGATAYEQSVWRPVPNAGLWATVLLLDGNVGIGGDPVALLRRVAELLLPGGRVLAELEPEGVGLQTQEGRLETEGRFSRRFRWGRVGVDGLPALAAGSGFAVEDVVEAGGRWFAELRAPGAPAAP